MIIIKAMMRIVSAEVKTSILELLEFANLMNDYVVGYLIAVAW
jgi:hypothetical protein